MRLQVLMQALQTGPGCNRGFVVSGPIDLLEGYVMGWPSLLRAVCVSAHGRWQLVALRLSASH